VHLSAADAGELARVSRARQLVVTHIDADEDGQTIALAAAGIYAGPVHLALPGLRFTI
jgi:ribonuclease BN (tRNA processing enzyme)